MTKFLNLTAACILAPATAMADTDYSALIGENGLASAAAQLESITDPTPSDLFALGGIRFLSAIEGTLQTRYTYGVHGGIANFLDVPLLRLPIYESPNPAPFQPEAIAGLFSDALADFDIALTALDQIGDTDAVQVTINTRDIWFDVNANGQRDTGEHMFQIMGGELDPQLAEATNLTITFDTADAAWLSAYAHLLSGVSETVLALDPTEAISTVLAGTAALSELNDPNRFPFMLFTAEDETFADAIAIFLRMIDGQPDVTRFRAAHAHFLGMVADNRVFWQRVVAERDNLNEWIPNKNQTSAMPLTFPADTGPRWQRVLKDAEDLLNGDVLLPHWRLDQSAGINLHDFMQNPPVMDLAGILQGHVVAPYAEEGRRIDARNLRAFEQLVGGDAPFFMIILN